MLRALVLVLDGFDDRDVTDVSAGLKSRGLEPVLVGKTKGETYKGGARSVTADRGYLNVDLGNYALVVVPGGAAGDAIAAHKSLVNIVYSVAHKGRAVAAIGTGVKAVLASGAQKAPYDIPTGVRNLRGEMVEGRTMAAPEALRDEIQKAGAKWTDRAVYTDGYLVTARDTAGAALDRFLDQAVAAAVHHARLVRDPHA